MSDALERGLARLTAPVGAPSDPPAALRDTIARDLRPARTTRWRRVLPAVAVAAAVVTAAGLLRPRADLAHQPRAPMIVAAVAWAVGALSGLAMLHSPGRYGLGPGARARLLWLVAALGIFEVVTAWSTVAVPGSVTPGAGESLPVGVACALEGSLPALLVALVVVRLARGTAVSSPGSAAMVAGAAAGFVGTLVQQLVCPVATHAHTMTAHAAPVLLGALAAAALARRAVSV
ncbi:MAG: NrsF family protein [Polyangiales bacterium]